MNQQQQSPTGNGTQSPGSFTKPATASHNYRKTLTKTQFEKDSRKTATNYNVIKNLEDKDIRNLSKVIEHSIVSSMRRGGKHSFHSNRRMSFTGQNDSMAQDDLDNQASKKSQNDQYVSHIRYGISAIDTNLELKKFIVKQTEKKQNLRNRLQNDIKIFMDDLIKVKEQKQSTHYGFGQKKNSTRFVREKNENYNTQNTQQQPHPARLKSAAYLTKSERLQRLKQQQKELISKMEMLQQSGRPMQIDDQQNQEVENYYRDNKQQQLHQDLISQSHINYSNNLNFETTRVHNLTQTHTDNRLSGVNIQLPRGIVGIESGVPKIFKQRSMASNGMLSSKKFQKDNSKLLNIISQCENVSRKNKSLVHRAQRHHKKFEQMKGMVQRNIERNIGDRTALAEDDELIQILSNYHI